MSITLDENDNIWPAILGANTGNDTVLGVGGNDSIDGGAGNDCLNGGTGDDTLIGGAGADWASYENAVGGVTVSLRTGTSTGAQGNDSLTGFEAVRGGAGDDSLVANGAGLVSPTNFTQTLDGGAGNDTLANTGEVNSFLRGGEGSDSLFGTIGQIDGESIFINFQGNDTLDGGIGNDSLQGNEGNDSLIGGEGTDWAIYNSTFVDVTVDLGAQTSAESFGVDELTGIENVLGGSGNDQFFGDGGGNVLDGGAGNDTLDGRAGDDTLLGSGGNDSLAGGAGTDMASYATATGSVTVDLGVGSSAGAGGTDGLTGIEQLIGSDFNDTLIAGSNTDVSAMEGNGGDDSLIAGSASNAALYGGIGADTLQAGSGTGQMLSGDDGSDRIIGSNAASQALYGEAGNDTLIAGFNTFQVVDGGADQDSVFGSAGNDTLEGGTENDTLQGAQGNDSLLGGDGSDWAAYGSASAGITVDLSAAAAFATGGDGEDLLSSIENLRGSNQNDSLVGDAGANTIIAGTGTDTLAGGAGNDWMDFGDGNENYLRGAGETGNDTLIGGIGNNTLDLGSNWEFLNETGGFSLYRDGADTIYTQQWQVVCFAEGTRVVTPNGEDAVENLRAGDMVLAMRGGQAAFEPLRWVGFMDVAVPRDPAMAAKTAPVLIKAGALAPGMPARDLRVSPDHAMEVDGHLIPAKHLVNGVSIIQEVWCKRVRYFHLELEAHGLLLSEGTWSESYLDDGNRHAFNNAALMGLFLDFEAGRSKGQYDHQACLPVLRQGLRLDTIHGRLALRAEEVARAEKLRRRA